ncbi:MarR family winged helix-turn-helix transcriptional regulator [Chenggangzhangella methanolivorans]|uniref:MarR family winged helix-turn-helix transcriptional regulator n=1 Tax=Chenggangzhangella methanolivorans TaxID=1437009 RepID=A0A9E6R9V7_9HYPH|nr:MarR family winged helix-turn-helix transcriptional regulator [Chenggangzhangella methanolivorans]QZO00222.1 MarR family winged helix-turn-helix transcriptional regulator [Chenggangzhangella methanolivorans]
MTAPTDDQLAALGSAFDVFARRYKLSAAAGAETPLNEVDTQILLYVGGHRDCGPTDVARFFGLPATTISSATDRLAKRGLLERSRTEGDRRAVALGLSEDGAARAASIRKSYEDMCRMMLERLTPEERDAFIAMITKIVLHED